MSEKIIDGRIVMGIAGFYYVETGECLYECKAKGKFRNEKLKPLVGDRVSIEIIDSEKLLGNISCIYKRDNELIRPAVSNVSLALLVFSLIDPMPSLNMIMRFFAMIKKQGVKIKLVFTKSDIACNDDMEYFKNVFANMDTEVYFISNRTKSGIDELEKSIKGETVVLAGPSGVGKSSLLNNLCDEMHMQTGAISEKIKRGKHTTRYSRIIPVDGDTYIVDTPGFTSLYMIDITEDELKNYFYAFDEYEGKCKFSCCSHVHEPGCAVREALLAGDINEDLYKCYVELYDDIKSKRIY